jgi:hypothetical protein
MRGQRCSSSSLFSDVSIEKRIPASHPLRRIRTLADQALDRLNSLGWEGLEDTLRARGSGCGGPC